MPGLLSYDEVKTGVVDHAIRFTTNVTDRPTCGRPGTQAGSVHNAAYPPMGARFRLSAKYHPAGLAPATKVVLRAMQKYGLILADNGSPWYFQGTADTRWSDTVLNQLKAIPAERVRRGRRVVARWPRRTARPSSSADAMGDEEGRYIYEVMYEHAKRGTMFDGVNDERRAPTRRRPELERRFVEVRDGHHIRAALVWINEIDVTDAFVIPPRPTPRERFTARAFPNPGWGWTQCHVQVFDQGAVIAEYERNYAMLRTFEPFRQGDRDFALISTHYTRTSVLDLDTGQVIATEPETPNGHGFCPVGFYVPDWWDVNRAAGVPGSSTWRPEDDEWPNGLFGFVWGAIWGDDSTYKVQYLDLSRVTEGLLARDERFGYLPLAASERLEPWEFIRCEISGGEPSVQFAIERTYDLLNGELVR